jgi:hypothetical protein
MPGDGSELHAAVRESMDELLPWMPWPKVHGTVEDSEASARVARVRFLERTELRMHSYLKGTGTLVGGSGLHRIDWEVSKFEIGYWCRTRFSGQGYTTETVRGIAAFAFDALEAKGVEIRCDPLNRPSACRRTRRLSPGGRAAQRPPRHGRHPPQHARILRHTARPRRAALVKHHRQDRPKGLWTDEAILWESEREVHVPPSGVRVEDAGRLLVHSLARRGTSRVWRSLTDRVGAERSLDLADHIEETCATGGTGLVWHAGDAISPPFMDDVLTQQGFEKTEDPDLDVLAFELGTDPAPKLPDLRVPNDVSTRPVRGEKDLRLVNVVEAGVIPASTWGEADTRLHAPTCAGSRNSTTPAEASGSRGRRVRPPVSGPRSEPPRRRTGGRGYRERGVDR